MKRLRIIAAALTVLIALLGAIAGWLAYTESGTRSLIAIARRYLPASLTLGEVSGALSRELHLEGLRYHDAAAGVDLTVESVTLTLSPMALIAGRVHVNDALVRGVILTLSPAPPPEKPETSGQPLEPPLDIIVDRLRVESATWRRADADPVVLNRAEIMGLWTHDGLILRKLDVSAAAGRVRATAHLRTRAPWLDQITADLDWTIGAQRWRGTVSGTAAGGKLQLNAAITTPVVAELLATLSMEPQLGWRATLSVPRFDPRRQLAPASSITSLQATLDADGDAGSARIHGVLGVDDQLIHVVELLARRNQDTIELPAIKLRLGDEPGLLNGHARLVLAQPLRASGKLDWEEILLPDRWAGPNFSAAGSVTFAGSAERFALATRARLNRSGRQTNLALRLTGSTHSLQIEALNLTQQRGELNVKGSVELDPPLRWKLDAVARQFDPGAFAADWRGALQFRLNTAGELSAAGPRASFRLAALEGNLRGRAITGAGELQLDPGIRITGQLRVHSGQTSLDISSTPGTTSQVDARLSIGTLAEWRQSLRGRVQLHAHASGKWPATAVQATLDARDLLSADDRVDQVHITLEARNSRDPEGTFHITASGVAAGGLGFETIEAGLTGTRSAHSLKIRAQGTPLGASLDAAGGLAGAAWTGTIGAMKIGITDMPMLALESPARVSAGKESFEIERACFAGGKIGVCLAAARDGSGAISANYSIRELPLELLARLAFAQKPFEIEGAVNGDGTLQSKPGGSLAGTVSLNAPRGAIIQGAGDAQLRLDYVNLGVEAEIAAGAVHGRLHGGFPEHGELKGELAVDDLRDHESALRGNALLTLRGLAPVAWFVPQLASIDGNGELAASVTGTAAAPKFAANLRLRQMKTEIPALGIKLIDGDISAALEAGGATHVSGKVTSDGGTLELTGGGPTLQAIEVLIKGNNFLLADIPGVHLVVTPDLKITRTNQELLLTGKVTLPSADLDLEKLPGGGGEGISSDVVVVDREQTQSARATTLRAEVEVILGERVKLVGFGLDSQVSGELHVYERPDEPATGSGEIRLAGSYEAFGRKLAIERGRLQFASSPLDNPQLDILAVRKLPEVTAKLRVTGTAQRPELSVYADPAMSQTDAMSYLVTGRAASSLSGEDGKKVESAAQSLGGILGNRLAKKMGPKLGLVDSVGVEQSDQLGGSVFTVGKYLSPKLFVSYGVGLFEPGTVVTLRYQLSRNWSVEANQAPEDQRAGIHYRIER